VNRIAVQTLLADAEHDIMLTEASDIGDDAALIREIVANAQKNYIDLVRGRRPLILADEQNIRFRSLMERLRARVRFFRDYA